MKSRAGKALGALVVLAVAAAGCGDDDEGATGDVEAYCELARELDDLDGFPTAEQLEEIREAAPEEISDEVDVAATMILEASESDTPEAVFEDPELNEAFAVIEPYEEENCGIDHEGEDEGEEADFEVAAEDAEYCALATTLNEQEDFPTLEQLEEFRTLAPDEIAEEADFVADAFIAAGDDPFAAFEAPGMDEAFGVIEPFDEERCGIDHTDAPDQDPSVTQLDPEATRIDVRATDYAFELSAAPTAGRTSFVMANEGAERHVMLLFRKAPGASTEDVIESQGEEGVEEEWESEIVTSGEEAVLTADLVPGDYGLICFIETADGPHFMLGMQEEFTIS